MTELSKYVIIITFSFVFLSCGDIDISESWAKNKFKEETGLISSCRIDSVKRFAGQACIFATITNEARKKLEDRLKFVSNKEFLKEYFKASIGYVPFSKQLFNLDSIRGDYLFYLKTYTTSNKMTGTYAESYYVTLLSKKENKVIFTEAFADL